MGIPGLAKLINDLSPDAIYKESDLKTYSGKVVAIDASLCLYKCLTGTLGAKVTSPTGDTGHLIGTFYSNIRFLENRVKPVYIFDGKPPKLKSGVLKKRAERRKVANEQLIKAKSEGDMESVDKFKRRTIKVNGHHIRDLKALLRLMGIPYFQAPGEAEAQCAALVRAGKVYATATEDMDALAFGSKVLLRNTTFKVTQKSPIQEIRLDKVLSGLNITTAQFLDLSILLGCDYCGGIKGIGPKRAIEMIKEHRNIETILKNIDRNKFEVPDGWLYKEARHLFANPVVADCDKIQFKWGRPDKAGITEFLCGEKLFNQGRISKGIVKL